MIPICILAIEDESDREFMTMVYTRYRWLIYDTVKQVVGDHWSTEDAAQITLVKLIDKLEKLKSLNETQMINYIITACKHTAYNEIRYRTRHPVFSIDEERDTSSGEYDSNDIEAKLIHEDELRRMANIWDKLDERSRFVLEARYILEKTDAEIAESLEIKPGSVRMLLTRARKKAFDLMETASAG